LTTNQTAAKEFERRQIMCGSDDNT